ncbi:hypothetical protein HMI55_001476 [Coelomomyces lativittatus]|nr:hypothetical protein HMI55_001476 [Coelomomyces lativittatus]
MYTFQRFILIAGYIAMSGMMLQVYPSTYSPPVPVNAYNSPAANSPPPIYTEASAPAAPPPQNEYTPPEVKTNGYQPEQSKDVPAPSYEPPPRQNGYTPPEVKPSGYQPEQKCTPTSTRRLQFAAKASRCL